MIFGHPPFKTMDIMHDLHIFILQHFNQKFCVPISVKNVLRMVDDASRVLVGNSPPRDPQRISGHGTMAEPRHFGEGRTRRAWNATCHPRFLKENYQNSFFVELNVKRLNKEASRIMTFLGAGIPTTKLLFAFVTSGKGSRYQRMLKS